MAPKDIRSLMAGRITKVATTPSTTTKASLSTSTETKVLKDIASGSSFASRWKIIGTHLIHNLPSKSYIIKNFKEEIKIAAFDLDGTLIDTKSGRKFAISSHDWKWWTRSTKDSSSQILTKLNKLIEEKYLIVIFTNQGGVVANPSNKSYNNFIERVNLIISTIKSSIKEDNTEILVFASPKKPAKETNTKSHELMRKPNTGMWKELLSYLGNEAKIDVTNSFYVGDAAGRAKDFSDSDLKFAQNIGITNFKTPEEFF
ncbi:polynucleotide kinase 3 phosphatase-domain-containing protein [Scheffersomyces coipomensis]|uniref:polynucleotide kinase 3 phosphatase-domain-containing protein n=1 Tax=Scheffersomyces coipomensis TaxID=1788519 RepID=UPI00315CA40E